MWGLGVCSVALLLVCISHLFYSWANPKCKNGSLPPGSMGLPIIGETLQFFSSFSLYEIQPFIRKRMARYGPLFRTSVVGQKLIVSTDNEINYSIFQQENKSFVLWYTESFSKIFGREKSLLAYDGKVHKYFKNLILRLIGPEQLRDKLLQEVDETICRHLHSWATHGNVDLKLGISQMIVDFVAKKLISYDETKESKKLGENYQAFMDGLISFPLNIPGTSFHASLQGRKKIMKMIENIYHKRKASEVPHHDFLDVLLEEKKKDNMLLNDTVITNLIFVLLFAAQETTSQAITLLTKFVFEHPHVLAELTKEHEAIIKNRDNERSGITWEEYKSLTFTHMVMNETFRLANIAPGIFRKVVQDVEIKGYTIPAGWTIMMVPSVVHFNPDKYEDPFAFNPWRWQGRDLHSGSKTFMAFGCGVRLCVGADFAKLQIAIFIHYLVTKYRWSVIKGGDVVRKPGITFPNGIQIEIAEKKN